MRLELDIDRKSGRMIGRIKDRETGELIKQVPSEEMVRLLAKARETIGVILGKSPGDMG